MSLWCQNNVRTLFWRHNDFATECASTGHQPQWSMIKIKIMIIIHDRHINHQSILIIIITTVSMLAEWRSGSVSALPCERPGFASRTCLMEIIPANNCTMQGQNNWGNWGFPGVMKLWVAWEVLRWLMKFRELCSGGFHPKLVTPPYHGFLNVNTPPNSQNSKWH